jgi:hypothetical protein
LVKTSRPPASWLMEAGLPALVHAPAREGRVWAESAAANRRQSSMRHGVEGRIEGQGMVVCILTVFQHKRVCD